MYGGTGLEYFPHYPFDRSMQHHGLFGCIGVHGLNSVGIKLAKPRGDRSLDVSRLLLDRRLKFNTR
jgi:hypothetical protein